MSVHVCDNCKSPLHGSPWVVYDRAGYLFCCTPECKQAVERELERIAQNQRAMKFGIAAWVR